MRITGLRAPSGPGIEFLHYLTPADGRPTPLDTRSNDLWHWQTAVRVGSASRVAEKLNGGPVRFVSAGIATTPDRVLGFNQAFVIRDADGHALRLAER